jgi:hypothetical protein
MNPESGSLRYWIQDYLTWFKRLSLILIIANTDLIYFILGQYLELSEDKNTERYQQLLADFEKRKKVKIIFFTTPKYVLVIPIFPTVLIVYHDI